jgi:sugar-specific transcriptional regulator TrmB
LTASETAKLSGVPRQNTYKALEKLLFKGLIVSLPGEVKRYAAAEPKLFKEKAISEFKKSMESELAELEARRREIIESSKTFEDNANNVAAKLETLYKQNRDNGDPLDYIEVLKNPLQIHHKFIQLCSEAKTEIMGFVRPPFTTIGGSPKEALELKKRQGDTHGSVLKKKVIERSIWEIEAVRNEIIPYFEKLDMRIVPGRNRVTSKLPIKMAVFDRKLVLYNFEDQVAGNQSITSMVTQHSALANAFIELFEFHWEKAEPLEDFLVREGVIKNVKDHSIKAPTKKEKQK